MVNKLTGMVNGIRNPQMQNGLHAFAAGHFIELQAGADL
jgi:hypothetical protein